VHTTGARRSRALEPRVSGPAPPCLEAFAYGLMDLRFNSSLAIRGFRAPGALKT